MSFTIGQVRFLFHGPFEHEPPGIWYVHKAILAAKKGRDSKKFKEALDKLEDYFKRHPDAIYEQDLTGKKRNALELAQKYNCREVIQMLEKHFPETQNNAEF